MTHWNPRRDSVLFAGKSTNLVAEGEQVVAEETILARVATCCDNNPPRTITTSIQLTMPATPPTQTKEEDTTSWLLPAALRILK